jgi:hypothetical protein
MESTLLTKMKFLITNTRMAMTHIYGKVKDVYINKMCHNVSKSNRRLWQETCNLIQWHQSFKFPETTASATVCPLMVHGVYA